MNLLLEQFDIIFDSPESVEKLEELILVMAVEGKLVSQKTNDEPANILMERIQREKKRLIQEKKIKTDKVLPPILEEEKLFELPRGWKWTRIGEICSIKGGKRVPNGYKLLDTPTEHAYIRVADMKKGTISTHNMKYIEHNIFEKIKQYVIYKEDLYITIAGTIGKVGTVPEELNGMNLTENAARIINLGADKHYLYYCFLSRIIQIQFENAVNQMAQPKLALKRIEETMMPLPPIQEQKRIVERINQLMSFCEELKKRLEKKQRREDKLNTSAFSFLEQSVTKEDLKGNLQFILSNLQSLCTETKHVKQLKNAVLSLAVKGNLVPQDEKDEPARLLLDKIMEEKEWLIREKKIKREKPLLLVTEEEKLFELPRGWEWIRLGDVINLVSGQHIEKNRYNEKMIGVPYLTGPIDFGEVYTLVSKWTDNPKVMATKNSILITVKGSGVGKLNILSEDACIGRQLMAISPILINFEYLLLVLKANQSRFAEQKVGIAIPGIGREDILNLVVALPPLNEQRKISEKANKLMLLCKELERNIKKTKQESEKLMKTVLQESFTVTEEVLS